MHEFSLYGQKDSEDVYELQQQLAGFARMQPQSALELHLIFKGRPPAGLDKLPSAGGTQGVMPQDMQRLKNSLNASLYYVQMVGKVRDIRMSNDPRSKLDQSLEGKAIDWRLEFKDTPEAGKQPVTMRLVSHTEITAGDIMPFMQNFGYEYVSRYLLRGHNFYDQDTTLLYHQILKLPQVPTDDAPLLKEVGEIVPFDESGGWLLQASILVPDGNNQDFRDRATTQLLAIRDIFKPVIALNPGDRLALDSKVPATSRR